jgi:hypothetical protein
VHRRRFSVFPSLGNERFTDFLQTKSIDMDKKVILESTLGFLAGISPF